MQGKDFYKYSSSLFKNESDWQLQPPLIHHFAKVFDAISVSNPKFFPTLLVIPKRSS